MNFVFKRARGLGGAQRSRVSRVSPCGLHRWRCVVDAVCFVYTCRRLIGLSLLAGVGNIMPPHVTHPPVTTASAGKPLTISVAFLVSGGSAAASVEVRSLSSAGMYYTVAVHTHLIVGLFYCLGPDPGQHHGHPYSRRELRPQHYSGYGQRHAPSLHLKSWILY